MKAWRLILLLPLAANAQPPAPYTCTHMEYIFEGWVNPLVGAPYACEAFSFSTANDSYTYYFPQASQQADPPAAVAAPEISPSGAASALALLAGLLLAGCARRAPKRPSRDDRTAPE